MKKTMLLIGIIGAVCLSSCTKHEYCECSYKTPIKGTIVKQIFYLKIMWHQCHLDALFKSCLPYVFLEIETLLTIVCFNACTET